MTGGALVVVENKAATNDEKRKLLDNAVAIVEMEGYCFSEKDKDICMRLFDGRLKKSELAESLKKMSEERIRKANAL